VVCRSACPKVADTRVTGAPLSMAWDARVWRSPWIDAAGLTPARSAASLTVKLSARLVYGLPGAAERIGTRAADAGSTPRLTTLRVLAR